MNIVKKALHVAQFCYEECKPLCLICFGKGTVRQYNAQKTCRYCTGTGKAFLWNDGQWEQVKQFYYASPTSKKSVTMNYIHGFMRDKRLLIRELVSVIRD